MVAETMGTQDQPRKILETMGYSGHRHSGVLAHDYHVCTHVSFWFQVHFGLFVFVADCVRQQRLHATPSASKASEGVWWQFRRDHRCDQPLESSA